MNEVEDAAHRAADVGLPAKPAPDRSCPQILRAEQRDTQIDSHHLGIHPLSEGMEGIGNPYRPYTYGP